MKKPGHEPSPADLQKQREMLRRNFTRANTAVAVILIAVLGLASAAVLASRRATRHQQRAEEAQREARTELARAYLSDARATRLSEDLGRRARAWHSLQQAAAIRPTAELRHEAIACLSLPDFVREQSWPWPSNVTAVAFDRELQLYAMGSHDGDVEVRRLSDNAALRRLRRADGGLPAAQGRVMDLEFAPDSQRVVVSYERGGFAVWEIASARVVLRHGMDQPRQPMSRPRFSGDGRHIISPVQTPRDGMAVFDAQSGEILSLFQEFYSWRHAALRPGATVFAINGETNLVMNWQTRERVAEVPFPRGVRWFTWSPDGTYLIVCGNVPEVQVWDFDRKERRLFAGHTAEVLGATVDPASERFASASADGTSRLWDLRSGRFIGLTREGEIRALASDGRVALVSHRSRIEVRRLGAGALYHVRPGLPAFPDATHAMDLSADGRWLVTLIKEQGVLLWDLESESAPQWIALPQVRSFCFHPTEPRLCVLYARGAEWRNFSVTTTNGVEVLHLGEPTPLPLAEGIGGSVITLSRDGGTLAMASASGRGAVAIPLEPGGQRVELTNLAHHLAGAGGRVTAASPRGGGTMALSPDGRWLACGFNDQGGNHTTQIWDTRTGQITTNLSSSHAVVEFSPDGRWLVLGEWSHCRLLRTSDWSEVWRRPWDVSRGASGSAAFSPDGKMLAVTKTRQKAALWNAATGRELTELEAPAPFAITSLRWSQNGRRLVLGTGGNRIQVWELDRLQRELATLGLDWEGPAFLATVPGISGIARAPLETGGMLVFGLIAAGVISLVALLALRRHRSLIHDYLASESMARQRHRELEGAKVELMHSQKMKALGTLAAGIAHDFNNLLSVIRMSNKLIGRATKNNPDVAEEVANIEEAALQGKHVVSSMLGYSRERTEENGPCDLDEVVEETVSLLSKEFLSGIELMLTLERNAPPVDLGRGRLEQILLNLVVNASEAMKGQGQLKIAVRPRAAELHRSFVLRPRPATRYVELSVTDSGPGIPPDVLPRIFEPFFTTKQGGAKQGTGLGLSMVYTIAEQDGLGLAVESAPGKGATFVLLVPCAPEAQFTAAGRAVN